MQRRKFSDHGRPPVRRRKLSRFLEASKSQSWFVIPSEAQRSRGIPRRYLQGNSTERLDGACSERSRRARHDRSLFSHACSHRVELPGGAKFLVLVCDEVGVFLDEGFSRWTEIELFGMIAEKFAMHAGPDEPAIRVDVYFSDAQFCRGQIFLLVNAACGRIELATSGIDALDFGLRHAGRSVHDNRRRR